jgi:hypothetical protein
MSIIATFRDERKKRLPYGSRDNAEMEPTKSPKIHDLSILKTLVTEVMNHMKTKEVGVSEYRVWDYCYEVPVRNLIGHVDKATWIFMLESCVEWAIDCHGSVQPNGRWELYDFEVQTEDRNKRIMKTVGQREDGKPELLEIVEPVQYLVVGMRYVDVKGQEDLVYEMGRPTTRKNSGLDAKSLQAILSNSGGGSGETEKLLNEQKTQIERQDMELSLLKEQVAKQNELMAGLLAELQQPAKPTRSTRSKK